jgi:hypothetical protein
LKKVNVKHAAAALGAALILAGSPAFASAAEGMQSGPIRIDNVQLYGMAVSDDENMNVPAYAAVAFTNEYDAPATEVVFVLETNGFVIDRFDDVGTFGKGVTIHHRFAENRSGIDQRVAVERASFADGTVWTNSAVSDAPQPDAVSGVRVDTRF